MLPAPRNIDGIGSLHPERIDVPGNPGVYYVPETDNFYDRKTNRGMGDLFYRQNIHLIKG